MRGSRFAGARDTWQVLVGHEIGGPQVRAVVERLDPSNVCASRISLQQIHSITDLFF